MNEAAAREVLVRLADAPVMLWRGDSLTGTDIDLLVSEGWDGALAAAGLEQRDTHWVSAAGDVLIDPMPVGEWPRYYPPAAEVIARAERRDPDLPPVASAADRIAIFIADAVAGRSMAKLEPKIDAAIEDAPLDPFQAYVLDVTPPRDALPWRRAIYAAAKSRRMRHALRARLGAALLRRLPQKKR